MKYLSLEEIGVFFVLTLVCVVILNCFFDKSIPK